PFPLPDGTAPNSGNFQAFFADIDTNPTTLSQTLTTVVGQQYAVSFYLAQQLVGPGTGANFFTASLGGTSIANLSDVGVQDYTQYTAMFTATSNSSVLNFKAGDYVGEFLL